MIQTRDHHLATPIVPGETLQIHFDSRVVCIADHRENWDGFERIQLWRVLPRAADNRLLCSLTWSPWVLTGDLFFFKITTYLVLYREHLSITNALYL